MKLKGKLVVLVSGVVLFAMFSSSVVMYLLLGRQQKDLVHGGFNNTANIIRDDLAQRMDKQRMDTENLANTAKFGDMIKYIQGFSQDGQFSITKDTYHRMTSELATGMRAGGFWQTAVYGENGVILAYGNSSADKGLVAGYRYKDRGEIFASATISGGAVVNEAEFATASAPPISDLPVSLGKKLPSAAQVFVSVVGKNICLETQVPLVANRYNPDTDKTESVIIGMLMSRSMIGETFVQRIEKLTGTPVNLFLADRTVSAAALQEYKQLQADDALISAYYTDLFSQPPVFNTLQLGDREFFQALLPIVSKESGNALVGWIAMAQDRQQSHAAVVKMVRMLVLVFLVCMVVIAPVTYLVAAMFSRKVGTVVDGLRDIAEGEGDLTHRLTMTGKDELADLSHWFNAIIENLHTIITRIAENANHLGKSSGSLASLADEMQSGARGVKTLDTRISQV